MCLAQGHSNALIMFQACDPLLSSMGACCYFLNTICLTVYLLQEQYENPVDHEESPMERALKKMLTSDEPTQNRQLKTSISNFLKSEDSNRLSFQENKLRTELRKTMRVDSMDRIVLMKPRTLKAFILDEEIEDIKPGKCCCAIACVRFWGTEGHCFC